LALMLIRCRALIPRGESAVVYSRKPETCAKELGHAAFVRLMFPSALGALLMALRLHALAPAASAQSFQLHVEILGER